MADCTDYPTPEDAKRFKNNANSVNEFVTSDSDTFVDQDGGEHITIEGIEQLAENQRDDIQQRSDTQYSDIDTLAEDQRDQFNATFQAQFQYARIGNISDFVGDTLNESEKLNSYQYPDDSGNWYGAIQSQAFPITIPADPTVSGSGWVLMASSNIYRGLWPDTGGSANKGDTYQTQVSGIPTGQYFTALQDTAVDPVGDDVNWREIVVAESITKAQNDIVGGSIFKGSNGETVENGDLVPVATSYIRTAGGDFTEKTLFPVVKKDGTGHSVSGVVSNLNLTVRPYSATIGNDDVWLLDIKYHFPGKGLNIMLFWPDPTGAQESSVQFQAWASFCINNPRKPIPGYIPTANGLFRLSDTIEVIKKDTEVCYGIWEVFGDGGGGAANDNSGILVDSDVPMFRICQQADGQYPEGDDFVIDPLHYLRRVHFHDFNCRGVLNGLSSFVQGRGVYLSTFERLGGYNHDEWVRLGNLTDEPTLNSQGFQLDYCEGNTISQCATQRVNKQIRVKNPDGLVIKDCPRLGYGNSTWTTDGYVLYTSGGNDTVRFEGNIVRCTSIVSNSEAPQQVFKLNGTRGLDLSGNHFERINGRFMNAVGLESFTTGKTNLFSGITQTATTLFQCDSCPVGFSFIFEGNNWAMPEPSDIIFRFNGSNTGWVTRLFDNNVTTILGGGTVYELTSNVIASNEGYGSWKQPVRWLSRYLWITPSGNMRSSSSIPTGVSDGETIAPYNPTSDFITSSVNPTISDVPDFYGQEWLNTTSKVWFKATSDGGDWKKITNEDPAT